MPLSKPDRQGVLIWCVVGGVVVALLAAYAAVIWLRPIVGPDNCVYEDIRLLRRAPTNQTVILVDQSEALTDGHRRVARKLIDEFVADEVRFPVRSRIGLFVFSKLDFPAHARTAPKFRPNPDLCRPPSQGNELYENNRRITKQFFERFLQPFTLALDRSLTIEMGERSPILETLQFISRSHDIENWDRRTTLIIVSDMLQHTEGFSHYRSNNSYDDFLRSAFGKDVKADFHGWDVNVFYLRRYGDRHLQQAEHLDFWQRYFAEAGGKITGWTGVD